jgi:hypothetical protein
MQSTGKMKFLKLFCFVFALFTVISQGQKLRAQKIPIVPFPMDWEQFSQGDLDLSFLNDKPAGKNGFILIKEGHFYTSSGKRFRIWGVNLTGGACFPEKKDAVKVALYISKLGINTVRFHFLDSNWGEGRSLFPAKGTSTRVFDQEQLDKLDYFVNELRKNGVYSNFNLNVGRNYRQDDGIPFYQYLGIAKAVTLFDDRIIKLEKEYAMQLLTHVNPYTGNEYRNEPALAFIEIVNENSLIEAWFGNRLTGTQQTTQTSTWSDIPAFYADELTKKYNSWLKIRLSTASIDSIRAEAQVKPGDIIPRLTPGEFNSASKLRFYTEARFIMETEDKFYYGMYRYLKDTVKVDQSVAANSDHNHSKSGYALLSLTSKLDFVDGHVYWQHPNYFNDPVTGKQNFTIPNTPMVNEPFWSTIAQLSRSAVSGKPYTISETNHPFPNEYACEGIVPLAAYGLLQDWDGIYFYTFEHDNPFLWKTKTPKYFDIQHDPAKMANLAIGGVLFVRADAGTANTVITRNYSETDLIEGIRHNSGIKPFFTPGFSPATPLVYQTRIGSFSTGTNSFPEVKGGSPILSETAEFRWDNTGNKGVITINTPGTQALIGFAERFSEMKTLNLQSSPENPFCSVVLTSLDGKSIAKSSEMLLSVTSRSELTGMVWTDNRKSLAEWGNPPFLIEPVRGTFTLSGLKNASAIKIIPLDGAGRKIAGAIKVPGRNNSFTFKTGNPATVWYLISVLRS